MRRKNKERLAKATALARKEAAGDFSHLRDKNGKFLQTPLPQPTLPDISFEDFDDSISVKTAVTTTASYPSKWDCRNGLEDTYSVCAHQYPPSFNMQEYKYPVEAYGGYCKSSTHANQCLSPYVEKSDVSVSMTQSSKNPLDLHPKVLLDGPYSQNFDRDDYALGYPHMVLLMDEAAVSQ